MWVPRVSGKRGARELERASSQSYSARNCDIHPVLCRFPVDRQPHSHRFCASTGDRKSSHLAAPIVCSQFALLSPTIDCDISSSTMSSRGKRRGQYRGRGYARGRFRGRQHQPIQPSNGRFYSLQPPPPGPATPGGSLAARGRPQCRSGPRAPAHPCAGRRGPGGSYYRPVTGGRGRRGHGARSQRAGRQAVRRGASGG